MERITGTVATAGFGNRSGNVKDVGSRRTTLAAMALEPATVDAVISAPAGSKPD